jgi:competence protein ComEC
MAGLLPYVLIGFASGVFTASFSDVLPQAAFLVFILGTCALGTAFAFKTPRKSLCLALTVFFVGLGLVRFELAATEPAFAGFEDREVALRGIIGREPEIGSSYSKLIVDPTSCCGDFKISAFNGNRILVEADQYGTFSYGDEVIVRGNLTLPKNFANEDGREFDYVRYLEKDKILYVIKKADVERTGANFGNPIRKGLFALKAAFVSKMEAMLPYPHAGVLEGVTLGVEGAIGKDFEEALRRSGLIHMIVLSGYNVTIVAEGVMKALSFLPRGLSFAGGTLAIVLFAVMTGGTATVVRASVMSLSALLARAAGRVYAAGRALFIAGFAMVLHNPYLLAFDLSFQLSFLATLGLVYVSPMLEPYLSWITPRFKLRELVSTTLGTQIAVLPVILHSMGDISLLALPANLIVLPVVPWVMALGALGALAAFVSPVLAVPFAFLTYLLISYVRAAVEAIGSVPFASVHLSKFPSWLLVLCYAVLAFAVLRFHGKEASKAVA